MSSSDQNNSRDSPTSPHSNQRRSSFVDMFNSRASVSSQNQPPRRLSITTLGLSTLPQAQSSPFSAMRTRAESISSANSTSVDESPFEDEASSSSLSTSVPATPFARRMSFGAQQRAMRGSVGGVNLNNNGNANGRAPISSAGIVHKASASSQTSKSRGLSCCSLRPHLPVFPSTCKLHCTPINHANSFSIRRL